MGPECQYCYHKGAKLVKEKGYPAEVTPTDTSPQFAPLFSIRDLTLSSLIHATATDLLLRQLPEKVDRCHLLSLISWDVECLSVLASPRKSSGPEDEPQMSGSLVGFQPPYAIACAHYPSNFEKKIEDRHTQSIVKQFNIPQLYGTPRAESVYSMVEAFLDYVFSMAEERAKMKSRILDGEIAFLEGLKSEAHAHEFERTGNYYRRGFDRSPWALLLKKLQELTSSIFLLGFRSLMFDIITIEGPLYAYCSKKRNKASHSEVKNCI